MPCRRGCGWLVGGAAGSGVRGRWEGGQRHAGVRAGGKWHAGGGAGAWHVGGAVGGAARGWWRGHAGMQACRHAGMQACRHAGCQAFFVTYKPLLELFRYLRKVNFYVVTRIY